MAGLLDWLQTPSGIGLLSAVAGGMAGARRGQPVNNVGRGLSAGVTGYSAANDQIKQDADNKQAQQLKQMQMEQLQQSMNQQKELQTWKAGLPRIMAPTVTGTTDQGSQLADQQAAFGADGMQGLTESAQYADAPLNVYSGPDRRAVQEYMAQPGSPYIDDLMKQQLPKAPKWNVTERYNAQTGMPEKVLMDENNPTDVRPFGGAQADTVVADNIGGSLVYRGSRSANPISEMQRTATPEAVMTDRRTRDEGAANRGVTMRGQNINNSNAAAGRAVTIRGQDTADARTGKNGVMAGWKYDAGSDEWVAPPSPEYPQGQRSGNKAKSDAAQSMAYVIEQFRGVKGKDGKAVPGALKKATTGGIMGVSGIAGRVFDSQDAMRFDNLKEQMSVELRTLFRIPGEGALSDKEQAQYGVQLPNVKYSDETNEAILNDVENRIGIRTNLNANPHAPKQPKNVNQLPTKAPAGVDANIWQHMTPAERKLWQK